MAGDWDKLKTKLEQGDHQPRATDWAQMEAQLQAHPQFRKPVRTGLWLGSSLLLLLLGALFYWQWPTASTETPGDTPATLAPLSDTESTVPARTPGAVSPSREKAQRQARKASSPALPNKPMPQGASEKSTTDPAAGAPAAAAQKLATSPSGKTSAQRQTQNADTPQSVTSAIPNPLEGERHGAKMILVLPSKPWRAMEQKAVAQMDSAQRSAQRAFAQNIADSLTQTAQGAERAAEDFIDPATGFRLSGLSISGDALSDFGPRPTNYAWGLGATGHWRRQAQGLHLGLRYRQWHEGTTRPGDLALDSTALTVFLAREELQINSVWVIDSLYHGHWENDTQRLSVTDTARAWLIDSTKSEPLCSTAITQYLEIPVYFSYRWQRRSWSLELGGGLVFSQWLRSSAGSEAAQREWGLHLMLQPQISYRLNASWSLFTRVHTRYALRPTPEAVLPLRYGLQLGLMYQF